MVTLREITNDNLYEVFDLKLHKYQEIFVSSTAHSLALAWVYKDTAFPFAVYADDTLVGFVMMGYWEAKQQYTRKFLIDKRYQHKGYGKEALRLATEYLVDQFHVSEIYLGVDVNNKIAKKMYHSFGFRETGVVDNRQLEMKLVVSNSNAQDRDI